jgi:hypothetical protein
MVPSKRFPRWGSLITRSSISPVICHFGLERYYRYNTNIGVYRKCNILTFSRLFFLMVFGCGLQDFVK